MSLNCERGEEMASSTELLLQAYLAEYGELRAELIKRIGLRDNLIYAMLVAAGGLFSFSLAGGSPDGKFGLLLIPWVCVILGWMYVANDTKITELGLYFRDTLNTRIREVVDGAPERILGWEFAARDANRRRKRKQWQLFINGLTFIGSGVLAMAAFCRLSARPSLPIAVLLLLETALLIMLIAVFWKNRDFGTA